MEQFNGSVIAIALTAAIGCVSLLLVWLLGMLPQSTSQSQPPSAPPANVGQQIRERSESLQRPPEEELAEQRRKCAAVRARCKQLRPSHTTQARRVVR